MRSGWGFADCGGCGGGEGWFGGGHGGGDVRACVGVAGGEGGEGWCVDLEHFLVGEKGGDGGWMRVVERL